MAQGQPCWKLTILYVAALGPLLVDLYLARVTQLWNAAGRLIS
jgi:hypothetical protein